VAVLFVFGGIGALVSGGNAPLSTGVTQVAAASSAGEQRVAFSMSGRDRYTCVVDGDTIWLNGVNLRLESYDTPEPYNDVCGGATEIALAKRASAPLLALLNGNVQCRHIRRRPLRPDPSDR
jgi:endonuclease YncB( thermonuclease family)